jgi:hypothetical protein
MSTYFCRYAISRSISLTCAEAPLIGEPAPGLGQIRLVSCRVVSCRVVSCRVVSCRVVSCRTGDVLAPGVALALELGEGLDGVDDVLDGGLEPQVGVVEEGLRAHQALHVHARADRHPARPRLDGLRVLVEVVLALRRVVAITCFG